MAVVYMFLNKNLLELHKVMKKKMFDTKQVVEIEEKDLQNIVLSWILLA